MKLGKLPQQTPAPSAPSAPSAPALSNALPNALDLLDAPTGTTLSSLALHKHDNIDDALVTCAATCQNLKTALENNMPDVEVYLLEINTQLREFPELYQLLSDEDIAQVYKVLRNRSNVAITVAKSKTSKKAGLLPDGLSIGSLL